MKVSWSFGMLALVLLCMPLTAAVQQPAEAVGSVHGKGGVAVRGVDIDGLGTLFSADEIRTLSQGYAQISLSEGSQIELGSNTNARVDTSDSGVRVRMDSGSLAFSSRGSSGEFGIDAASWQVEGVDGSVATIALLDGNKLGVEAIEGSIRIRSSLTSDELLVQAGEVQVISVSELAGPAGPEPLPAPRRELSRSDWYTLGITAGVVGTGIGTWLIVRNPASPSNP